MTVISKIPFLGSLVLKNAVDQNKRTRRRILLPSLSRLLDKPP